MALTGGEFRTGPSGRGFAGIWKTYSSPCSSQWRWLGERSRTCLQTTQVVRWKIVAVPRTSVILRLWGVVPSVLRLWVGYRGSPLHTGVWFDCDLWIILSHKLILESELWHHATTGKSMLLLYRFHFLDVCRHFRTCCACTCKDYVCIHSQPKWLCHFGSSLILCQEKLVKNPPTHALTMAAVALTANPPVDIPAALQVGIDKLSSPLKTLLMGKVVPTPSGRRWICDHWRLGWSVGHSTDRTDQWTSGTGIPWRWQRLWRQTVILCIHEALPSGEGGQGPSSRDTQFPFSLRDHHWPGHAINWGAVWKVPARKGVHGQVECPQTSV